MKFKNQRISKLLMCLVFSLALLAGGYGLFAQATTSAPDYAIVLPGDQDAPLAGSAPDYAIVLPNDQDAPLAGSVPDCAIVLPGDQDAPLAGRAAPYGQWIITHNSVSGITTTINYGTVARTNGYEPIKRLICYNSGAYTATLSLYLRTTSTGSLYILEKPLDTVNPAARKVVDITDPAPWMSVGITSTDATTGTTMLCGIYVQTP